jgi:hypothetical protein
MTSQEYEMIARVIARSPSSEERTQIVGNLCASFQKDDDFKPAQFVATALNFRLATP